MNPVDEIKAISTDLPPVNVSDYNANTDALLVAEKLERILALA